MIHSFSAADPTDYQTIAGRWLAQGAFVYFGSVNEPFLLAFRTPRLVAELMVAGVPFVAALRQGEGELFGFPWRLVYLGDPLYRFENDVRTNDAVSTASLGRLAPGAWRQIAPEYATLARRRDRRANRRADWTGGRTRVPFGRRPTGLVCRCGDWRIDGTSSHVSLGRQLRRSPDRRRADLIGVDVLTSIRRDRLARPLRPAFDELLIDALGEAGLCEPLMKQLAADSAVRSGISRVAGPRKLRDAASRSAG